jgi:hypothetical protein
MNFKFKAKRDTAIKFENRPICNKPIAITRNTIYSEVCKDRKNILQDCSRTPINRRNKKILSKSPFDSEKNKSKNNGVIVYSLTRKVHIQWT